MADPSTPPPLPNPETPMAFLPPELARQAQVSEYVVVGSTAVLIWDILSNLKGDYKLLFKYRIRVPTIVYFISRLANLGYVLGSAIFETASTGNCENFEHGLAWMFTVALASNTLLFFFRVRAIYDRNIWVSLFFGVLWLSVIAGGLTSTQGIKVVALGPTKYCIGAGLKPYVGAAIIIPLVNDTLVFFAISWRLMRNSHVDDSVKNGFRALVFGTFMPAFSRALLQDGQAYYLATVTFSLVVLILLYVPGLPPVYKTTFTSTNIAVMNIMACRVYRNTRFGKYRETATLIDTTRHSGSDRTDASGPLIPVFLGGKSGGASGGGGGGGGGDMEFSGVSGKEKRTSDTNTSGSPGADEVLVEERSIHDGDVVLPESDIGDRKTNLGPDTLV